MSLDQLLDRLVEREQGYVNHPNDRGGPTNWGVTLRTLRAYRKHHVSIDELKALTVAQAKDVYRFLYWEQPGFNTLELSPANVEMIFDAGVHHGPRRAAQMLQLAIGVRDDGIIGPVTRKVAQSMDLETLAARYVGERLMFIARLVEGDPSQLVFLEGWMGRIREFILMIPQD